MSYLVEQYGLLDAYLLGALSIFLRYCIIAGAFFTIFYVWKEQAMWRRKIQQKLPKNSEVWFEIRNSVFTALIFGMVGIGIYFLRLNGFTHLYFDIAEYGWAYLIFSFFLLTVIHDTWFYWTHRLMHRPRWFEILHRAHHQSHNPTPWAAFSFHWTEAVVEIAFLPLAVLVIPFHPLVIFLFTIWSLVFNVLGHLGYEIFPSGFTRHKLFSWLNTATHHNMHHQRSNCNFSLYYNFWDRAMGTNHKDYHDVFERIQERCK